MHTCCWVFSNIIQKLTKEEGFRIRMQIVFMWYKWMNFKWSYNKLLLCRIYETFFEFIANLRTDCILIFGTNYHSDVEIVYFGRKLSPVKKLPILDKIVLVEKLAFWMEIILLWKLSIEFWTNIILSRNCIKNFGLGRNCLWKCVFKL